MKPDPATPANDPFSEWLGAYDDALAAGRAPPERPPELANGAGLSPRQEQARACLHLLEQVWPRSARDGADDTPDSSVPEPPPEAFSHLGRFHIHGQLGQGGGGIVFLATDPRLGREVALKVPRPEILLLPELRKRFLREARAAAILDHANVVPVYETGEVGQICYIVTPYCDGPTLDAWLGSQAAIVPTAMAAALVAQVAEGVQHAHDRGILHRDLKPGNILLSPAPNAKANGAGAEDSGVWSSDFGLGFTPRLTDFGLAKILEREVEETKIGAVFGTAPYMAPEQCEGRVQDIGPATDIYALGVILYQLLTHRPTSPLVGEAGLEELKRRLAEHVRPSKTRPGLPRDLEKVCQKCLEREPRDRYASAAALADDLRRFLKGESVKAHPVGPVGRTWRWGKRHPLMVVLWSLLLVAAVVVPSQEKFYRTLLSEVQGRYKDAEKRTFSYAEDRDRLLQQQLSLNRHYRLNSDLAQAEEQRRSGRLGPMRELLARHIPRTGGPDRRNFAWHYLWRLAHSELRSYAGHTGAVETIVFSSDGRRLASAGADGTVRLWDAAGGADVTILRGHVGSVRGIWFAPGGETVQTVGADGTLRHWEVSTGRQTSHVQLGLDPDCATFSGDGKWLALSGQDHAIQLWDVAARRKRATWTGHTDQVNVLRFSPDDRYLASASRDGAIWLWETARGQQLAILRGYRGAVRSVSFRRDGRLLVSGGQDGTVRLWTVPDGREQSLRTLPFGGVLSVGFSNDGQFLAAGGENGVIYRWATDPVAPARTFLAHTAGVNAVAFALDDRLLASAGGDGIVKLWDPARRAESRSLAIHPAGFDKLVYSSAGALAAVGGDGLVHCWDTGDGEDRVVLSEGRSPVESMAFVNSHPTLAVAKQDGTILFWSEDQKRVGGKEPAIAKDAELALCRELSADGTVLATGHADGFIRLLDATTGRRRATFQSSTHPVEGLAFSPDGRKLVARGGSRVAVWDLDRQRLAQVWTWGDEQVSACALSSIGSTLAVGMAGGGVEICSVSTGRQENTLLGHGRRITGLAFTPNDDVLATGSQDGTVKLWDVLNGQEMITLTVQSGPVDSLSISFAPDGKTLATATRGPEWGEVRLWSTSLADLNPN